MPIVVEVPLSDYAITLDHLVMVAIEFMGERAQLAAPIMDEATHHFTFTDSTHSVQFRRAIQSFFRPTT